MTWLGPGHTVVPCPVEGCDFQVEYLLMTLQYQRETLREQFIDHLETHDREELAQRDLDFMARWRPATADR